MKIDWMLVATIGAPIITLFLGAWLDRIIEARSRLVSYLGHVSSFKIRAENTFDVFTHTIIIKNGGRKAATNIRVGHNFLPKDFQIYPACHHEIRSVPDTAPEIIIPIMVPGEQITISYLYYPPVTWERINSYLKCDDGFAKILTVIPTQKFPKWLNYSCLFLILNGLTTIIYLCATVIIGYLR